ncbi:MAG: hypothetical protein AAF556_11200 [Pseudomonadota bacterium]
MKLLLAAAVFMAPVNMVCAPEALTRQVLADNQYEFQSNSTLNETTRIALYSTEAGEHAFVLFSQGLGCQVGLGFSWHETEIIMPAGDPA